MFCSLFTLQFVSVTLGAVHKRR